MRLVVISGLSGSGKSIALNVLEDAGYYCVDNLPSWLLPQLVGRLEQEGMASIAVAIDVRGGDSIRELPHQIEMLSATGVEPRFLFLDAKDEALIQRFSETRRRHPLIVGDRTLPEAIAEERKRLSRIACLGHRIDTSDLKPGTLRAWVRQFISAPGYGKDTARLVTVVFQSFGFKHGIPLDADLVFDVRCLPNPFYELRLRTQTGLDAPVVDFLEQHTEVPEMFEDIRRFVQRWLPDYVRDGRSYLTVAIGCTGGQHRSVYIVERLGRAMADGMTVLVRHREISAPAGR
jgi:RNase adapter protein RapZ